VELIKGIILVPELSEMSPYILRAQLTGADEGGTTHVYPWRICQISWAEASRIVFSHGRSQCDGSVRALVLVAANLIMIAYTQLVPRLLFVCARYRRRIPHHSSHVRLIRRHERHEVSRNSLKTRKYVQTWHVGVIDLSKNIEDRDHTSRPD
jgi:hypothetical protein